MLELTTLAHVKALLAVSPNDTTNDAVLEGLIEAVSTQAARYLNRVVEAAQQTEYLDVWAGDQLFKLRAIPVTSIAGVGEGVWADTTWVYSTALDATTYHVNTATGVLFLRSAPSAGPDALKVVYTGGMATTTDKFMASYPDLAEAIRRQVIYLFNTRRSIGADAVAIGESSVTWRGDVAWLPGVEAVLKSYRRGAL